MSLRRLVLAALLAATPLVTPAPARAQQAMLTFPGSLSNPVAGNYYVGPFGGATFVSALGQATTVSVLCVDFLNHVGLGDRFAVEVTNLGGGQWNPVEDTRHPGAAATYRKAAWLGSLFATTSTSNWSSVQYAVWNLFTPSEAPDDAKSGSYLSLASVAAAHNYQAFDYQGTHYAAVDMSQYWVLTDVNAVGRSTGGHQEFLVSSTAPLGPSATVPEPGTFVLLGTGIAIVGFLGWRRRA